MVVRNYEENSITNVQKNEYRAFFNAQDMNNMILTSLPF